MAIHKFLEDVTYNENGPAITVMSNDEASKEVRIVFKAGQLMKKHNAPYPISVLTLQGAIDFGYEDTSVILKSGDMIKLGAKVMHDLTATEDSIVILSLSKGDTIERVASVETA